MGMAIKNKPQFWELKQKPFVPYVAEHPPHLMEGGGKKCAKCGTFSNAHPSQESLNNMSSNEGGQLRPQRLTGEEMDKISPGWTQERMDRAQRSDGGNG
jgi:hypothetical protein